jgi:hypothetical protein
MPNACNWYRGVWHEDHSTCAGAAHLVRHAFTLVPGGRKMIHSANEKALGADDAEGFEIDTSNDLNFATGTRQSRAVATLIAEFALAGLAVLKGGCGDYLVSNYGMSLYCQDFAELQTFARKLGIQS